MTNCTFTYFYGVLDAGRVQSNGAKPTTLAVIAPVSNFSISYATPGGDASNCAAICPLVPEQCSCAPSCHCHTFKTSTLHLTDGTGQEAVARAGDLMHFPNGSKIVFNTPKTALGYYCGQRKGGTA